MGGVTGMGTKCENVYIMHQYPSEIIICQRGKKPPSGQDDSASRLQWTSILNHMIAFKVHHEVVKEVAINRPKT